MMAIILQNQNDWNVKNKPPTKKTCHRSVVSDSLWPHGLKLTRLPCSWDFPGKSTGVGCHFLLQRIFSTEGSNPGLPHCRQMLHCLSHQGSHILSKHPHYCLEQTCSVFLWESIGLGKDDLQGPVLFQNWFPVFLRPGMFLVNY